MTTASPQPSDAELARHIQERTPAGAEAEAELCQRFVPRVRSYGLRHLADADAAGELVQRVLMVVIEKLRARQVRELENIASFVLGTAHHVAREMRRADARTQPITLAQESWHEPWHEPSAPAALDVHKVAGCMQELEQRDRTVVALTFFEDLSAPEIAIAVGISAGNVRVMRHRALSALRACFERQGRAS